MLTAKLYCIILLRFRVSKKRFIFSMVLHSSLTKNQLRIEFLMRILKKHEYILLCQEIVANGYKTGLSQLKIYSFEKKPF